MGDVFSAMLDLCEHRKYNFLILIFHIDNSVGIRVFGLNFLFFIAPLV